MILKYVCYVLTFGRDGMKRRPNTEQDANSTMCSVLYAPPVPAPWLRLCKIKHISPSHTLYLFFSHPPLACIHTFCYCTGFSATAILSFIKSLHSILCVYLLLTFLTILISFDFSILSLYFLTRSIECQLRQK